MSWWSSLRNDAASVLTAQTRGAATVLRDAGATGLANDIDGFDSQVTSVIAGSQPELQLGQTDDPTQLIHGNPEQVGDAAGKLKAFGEAFDEVASGLAGVDPAHWKGKAADAFRAKFAPQPKLWSNAGKACTEASAALAKYQSTLSWAQARRGRRSSCTPRASARPRLPPARTTRRCRRITARLTPITPR